MRKEDQRQTPFLQEEWEIMDKVIKRGEPEQMALDLGVVPETVRTWKRRPETAEDYTQTGRRGPLHKLRLIIERIVLNDRGEPDRTHPIAHFVAALCGGVFVPVTRQTCRPGDSEFLYHVSTTLKETGQAVEAVRMAWLEKTPGRITQAEAFVTRKEILEGISALHNLLIWHDNHVEEE